MKVSDERDDVLLQRVAKGDESAFTALYRRHQGSLFRYAVRMTGSAWAAEEIVQDVFMTLIRLPKKYDGEKGEVGAFLFGITRNRIMKYIERTPRELPLDPQFESGVKNEPVDMLTPAFWAERRERVEQVRDAVLTLPTEFREAVVLCELEELSYEEAAQKSGCPIGTIRSRLHRGRALLMARLEMLRDVPRRASAGD
jgi:RNA polymerase sigma-70 factor (ECF subfamily)